MRYHPPAVAPIPTAKLARIHSLLGLVPLLGFVLVHVLQTSAAPRGRHAFTLAQTGAEGTAPSLTLEALLVLLPLAAHFALGVVLWRRGGHDDPGPYTSAGMRRVQRYAGAIVAVFLAVHVAQTYGLEVGGAGAAVIYDVLRDDLGRPAYTVLYVIGLTALSFHVGIGVAASASRLGIARTPEAGRVARVLGAVLAVAVWLVSVNTLAHFASGRAFFGAEAAPVPVSEVPR